jgi:hypothetical protein
VAIKVSEVSVTAFGEDRGGGVEYGGARGIVWQPIEHACVLVALAGDQVGDHHVRPRQRA